MKMLPLLFPLLLLALSSSSLGSSVTLSNVDDFIIFVSEVNERKNNYSGTTVYLDSDLSFSGKTFDPIGTNDTCQFLGTFDGQGHIISGLKTNSYSQYTGLFGYSNGLTIKNVVLDSSCSISSTYSGSDYVCVGGFIGYCRTYNGECSIENSVNMAFVTFSGDTSDYMAIGGIVGYLYSFYGYGVHVKNCVNYGTVTDLGTVSDRYAELGGIVGFSHGSSLCYNYVQNCLNYGTITHNGESRDLYAGGIVSFGKKYTCIENCVSAGKISTQTTASGGNYIGSIVGNAETDIYVYYCYHTSDVGINSINGTGTPESTTGTPTSTTTVDSDLVNKLNSNATSCNWSKWLLNANKATVTFKMSDNKELPLSSQIILTPNPVKEGNSFLFWCKDPECVNVFNPETESVSGITDLYAAWVNNTVTFDFDNGTTVNVTFTYDTEIIYPEMKKEGYTFSQWDNYHEFMPAKDITVTAQWTPNNYTVTFDANGGDVSEISKVVTFNKKYGNLPEPNRAGYVCIGWFTNETNGTEVTNETIVTTPDNHTLYAHWGEVTIQVEIVFNAKDLTQDEVKSLIEQYTKIDFVITEFETNNKSGEIRVIIGFVDKKEAENFITDIKESSEMTEKIKNIDFITIVDGSFSTMIYPLSFLNAFFL